MRSAVVRFTLFAVMIGLALVCVTVLAALGVVDGNRVLDMVATAVPAFVGALIGSAGSNGSGGGLSLRPPGKLDLREYKPPAVPAPYSDDRP